MSPRDIAVTQKQAGQFESRTDKVTPRSGGFFYESGGKSALERRFNFN
jgi:hypothetical protein